MSCRDDFREGTFARDGHLCVVPGCGEKAVDAHHIVERALWLKDDPFPEGYTLDNGASLCERHHIAAEKDFIPPQGLRHWLGLSTVLPKQLDPANLWTKWGKEIPRAPHGKYPRTPYLPFSPSVDVNDPTIPVESLVGKELVVTVKMDGANVSMSRERVTSRNGDTANGPQFAPLKAFHATVKDRLPVGATVFGEWLFARHSIAYEGRLALPAHLMVIAVREDDTQLFWSWPATESWAEANGLMTVPVAWPDLTVETSWKLHADLYNFFEQTVKMGHEGIVVRSTYPFHQGQFADNVGKLVRDGHNQCGDDWKSKPIIKNELRR